MYSHGLSRILDQCDSWQNPMAGQRMVGQIAYVRAAVNLVAIMLDDFVNQHHGAGVGQKGFDLAGHAECSGHSVLLSRAKIQDSRTPSATVRPNIRSMPICDWPRIKNTPPVDSAQILTA